jgi:amino acid transporter
LEREYSQHVVSIYTYRSNQILTELLAASVFQGVGSVGLSMIFWVIGFIVAAPQLTVYTELASYFPHRSDGEVVYLEQAYPRPKHLLPVVFAMQYVLV